jgi:EAL domain-containing protein (putative c-di-GMP-specific phosphodiesterase class I)
MVNGKDVERALLADGDLVHFADVAWRVCEPQSDEETEGAPPAGEICDPSGWLHSLIGFETLMNDRRVVPHFQRIVSTRNVRTQGYEALARSTIERLQMPAEMFIVAETLNAHDALSEILREESARAAQESRGNRSEFFFNLHPREFGTLRLNESLITMRETFPQLRIAIEVPEPVIADTVALAQFQSLLRSLDMRLSYDDFGSGHERLLQLVENPPHVLKFKMQLTRDIDEAPASRQEFVRSLVQLATDHGVTVVAKGIETEAEHRVCAELGFKLAQGNYYGSPETL